MRKKISFAIPCYNSANTIGNVIAEIHRTLDNSEAYDFEIITVVDGSPDNVYDVLAQLAKEDGCLRVINLAKNFGQANARMASFSYASGDYIVCLDDDGQCPVDKVLDLVKPLEEGYDISMADYPKKKQSLFKNIGSSFNKFTTRIVLDVPRDFRSSNFFAMKRFVKEQVILYKNPYPFMDGLISQATNKIAYVSMEERERQEGSTGYTFSKLVKLWMNGFTAFSVVPLRLSSLIGFICAFAGFVFGIITIIRKLVIVDIHVGWSSTISIMLFIGGLLMLMLGMIGEYVGRIYISINDAPQFVVRDTVNIENEQ